MTRARRFAHHAVPLLALIALTSALAGCNLAVGIEPLSGTPQDDFAEACVAVINEERAFVMFAPLERWIDNEGCALDTAEQLAAGMSGNTCGASSSFFCSQIKAPNESMLRGCFSGFPFDEPDTKVACASAEKPDGKIQIVALFH